MICTFKRKELCELDSPLAANCVHLCETVKKAVCFESQTESETVNIPPSEFLLSLRRRSQLIDRESRRGVGPKCRLRQREEAQPVLAEANVEIHDRSGRRRLA